MVSLQAQLDNFRKYPPGGNWRQIKKNKNFTYILVKNLATQR